MSPNRLQEDLLQEFKDHKQIVYKQLEIFEPLAEKLRKPAAQRLLGKGTLIFFEVLCYALTGCTIAMAVLMNGIFPFRVWVEIEQVVTENRQELADGMQLMGYAIAAVFILTGILFLVIARNLSGIRRKNDIINAVAKDIKTLVSQHLTRKATIQSIEERHFMNSTFEHQYKDDVNDIPNPGY